MNKKALTERLAALKKSRATAIENVDEAKARLSAINGALMEAQHWLATLDAAEAEDRKAREARGEPELPLAAPNGATH